MLWRCISLHKLVLYQNGWMGQTSSWQPCKAIHVFPKTRLILPVELCSTLWTLKNFTSRARHSSQVLSKLSWPNDGCVYFYQTCVHLCVQHNRRYTAHQVGFTCNSGHLILHVTTIFFLSYNSVLLESTRNATSVMCYFIRFHSCFDILMYVLQ